MKRPLIILSFDGLATDDIAYLKNKPGFMRFLDEASGSDRVKSIYPSVTYPAHASIITGCYPVRHGIVDNTRVQPERYQSPDWFWYREDIAVPTLYDIAKENNYSVAALLWPTTGKADIDYNMPEIFSNRKWTSQMMVSLYAGSPMFQSSMVMKHGKLRDGKKQPALDNFVHAVTLDTIRNYQPDMLLVHFTDLDSTRHLYGRDGDEAKEALNRHDIRLNRILDILGGIEKYNHAYIVVLGDHSSIDITHGISMNRVLIDHGLLAGDEDRFSSVKAVAKSCDGASYIYLMDNSRAAQVNEIIEKLAVQNPQVFKPYDKQALIDMGGDANAFMMLEALPPYHFVDDITDNWLMPIDEIAYYRGTHISAVHGFDPNRDDYQTVFFMRGPNVKQGVTIEAMSLVDIAPTLASFLQWTMEDVDGRSYYQALALED